MLQLAQLHMKETRNGATKEKQSADGMMPEDLWHITCHVNIIIYYYIQK